VVATYKIHNPRQTPTISAGFKLAIQAIKQRTQTAWPLELATVYFNNLNFGIFK